LDLLILIKKGHAYANISHRNKGFKRWDIDPQRITLPPGAKVEVIVRSYELEAMPRHRYPLRGQPLRYDDPFESVAEAAWKAKK
jgi:hypothetical protein